MTTPPKDAASVLREALTPLDAVVMLRTAIQLHQEGAFNSDHPALAQAMRQTAVLATERAAIQPATPPELAVQQAHDLLSKCCVADLSNGNPATLVERIEELYSWYAAIVNDTEPVAAIQPTGDAECRTTCNICADENGNAWPCAKSKARGAIPQEAKAELVGDAVWNALSLMLDVFHKPIGMFSNEARACEIARKALSAPASKSEASELPGLPDDAAAWVTPLRYGSKVTFPKPPKPDQWDDEEGEWYCNPLFNADQTTAYGQLCRDTAPNAWRQAIYDACAVAFIDCGPESDPRKAIEALIQVHIDAARQPVAAPFEQAARPAAESASNQTLTGDETENDQRQAATLNKLADQVVLANATGNEQLYLLAVTGLLAAVRALKSAAPVAPAQAVTDVLAERQRQKDVEGWTAERDDRYTDCELARAAATYAVCVRPEQLKVCDVVSWPWAAHWWKPNGYRRNLVKAAALLLAEIERLDRAAILAKRAGSAT